MILGAGGATKAIVTCRQFLMVQKSPVSMFAPQSLDKARRALGPYLNRQLAT